MALSAHISSALVELFALILFFVDIPVTDPLPNEMVAPMCPSMSGCEAYDTSTHHLIIVKLSDLKISGTLMVQRTWRTRHFNLPQSYSSGLQNLIVKKYTAVCMSFLALGHENNNWAIE